MVGMTERLKAVLGPLRPEEVRRIAAAMNVDDTTVYNWRSGRRGGRISREHIAALAPLVGMSIQQLMGDGSSVAAEGAASHRPEPKKADDWHLPRVAFAAAGSPIHDVLQDDATVWYAFRRGWVKHLVGERGLRDEQRLIVVQVDKQHLGESMMPTIRPGAIVVVDRGAGGRGIAERRDLVAGKIYLVNIEGGLTIKRVFVDDGALILVADNPDRERYPPQLVPLKGRELQRIVVGRVVWIGQEEV